MSMTRRAPEAAKKPELARGRPTATPVSSKQAAAGAVPALQQHHLGAVSIQPSGAVPVIQPKLQVGPVGDRYEQEADRVAEQVMRMPEPEAVQRGPADEAREEPGEDESGSLAGQIQRVTSETAGSDGFTVTPDIEARLQSSQGGGSPLLGPVRQFMEPRFSADFRDVKVHADAEADRLNRSLQARAFTTGRDLYFKRGEYSPATSAGQKLIAHELTHVVQQTGSVQRVNLRDGSVSDQEAEKGWKNRKQKELYRKKVETWAGAAADGVLTYLATREDYEPEDIDLVIAANKDAARWLADRSKAPAVAQPAAAPPPAPKPADPLANVRAEVKKLRKTDKNLSDFSDDDLETILAAKQNAKPQISLETAIRNQDQFVKQAQQKTNLAEDRKAKWAPALPVGEAAFQGNPLCTLVWQASYGVATGDVKQNASVGGKYKDDVIEVAVTRWRNQPTIVTQKGKVYDFHVPGKKNFIQDKSKRAENPDPDRGRQADFISNWANLKVNLHVDADPEH